MMCKLHTDDDFIMDQLLPILYAHRDNMTVSNSTIKVNDKSIVYMNDIYNSYS